MTTEIGIIGFNFSIKFENRGLTPAEKSNLVTMLLHLKPQKGYRTHQFDKATLVSALGRTIDKPEYTSIETKSKVFDQQGKGHYNTYNKAALKLSDRQEARITLPGYGNHNYNAVIYVRRLPSSDK